MKPITNRKGGEVPLDRRRGINSTKQNSGNLIKGRRDRVKFG